MTEISREQSAERPVRTGGARNLIFGGLITGRSRSTRRSFVAAILLALTVGLVAHLLHVGQHAGHEAGILSGVFHWLRDSLLAVPVAGIAVYVANSLTRRWTSQREWISRLRWALFVSLGYVYMMIPGGLAHGQLFPAERHSDALIHAVSDAIALLPASVYTAFAIAFLLGTPSEARAPVVVAFRAARFTRIRRIALDGAHLGVVMATILAVLPAPPVAASPPGAATTGAPAAALANGQCTRTVTADVVALDQPFYYNRLGAINANGMVYALARDVVVTATGQPVSELSNAERDGIAGQVSLRADKRPRPLTLRANEGDCLDINFTNLLDPVGFIFPLPGDFPTGQILGLGLPINNQVDDQPLTRLASIHIDGLELVGGMGSDGSDVGRNGPTGDGLVAPGASTSYIYYAPDKGTNLLYSMGTTIGAEGGGGQRSYGLFGALNVEPYDSDWYRSQLTRQEMDWATPPEEFVDWNGNGSWDASLTDVFDDLNGNGSWDVGEPLIEDWNGNGTFEADYPEPLIDTNGDFIWNAHRTTPGGQPIIDYDAVYPVEAGPGKAGLPIIELLNGTEIVHSDLNAIIDDRGSSYPANMAYPTRGTEPFREFTVIFHDESFGVQAFPGFYNDPVLSHTLHGVRDSFPINYGSGGIGSEIIANRLGVGPMWDCADCKYEEFFLTSFTVGDPAMIVDVPANTTDVAGNIIPGAKATKALYPDDPSNVHHSYLGDRVVFRNLHAGPKEHHIFHLHAHQWQFNPDEPESNYLDGQALGPGSGYSYEIAYGGSGNRNLTVGDSIFHCHFYPHFAQGMWELWRVHDVFEQGTLMDIAADGLPIPAAGSRALPDGEIAAGTPIPGVVPMPGMAMAPMPDAAATVVASDLNGDGTEDSSQFDANGDGEADIFQTFAEFGTAAGEGETNNVDTDGDGTPDIFVDLANPGYPWFTPGLVGHRPPTPAKDLLDDGGLPRHVVTSGPDEDNVANPGDPIEMYVSRLDFNKVLHEGSAIQLPEGGTAVEQIAMAFHAGDADGIDGGALYDTYLPDGRPVGTPPPAGGDPEPGFEVNGLDPIAGAPFADPCRAFDGEGPWTDDYAGTLRTIKGANIEMPVTLNKVGWHFQQQRFEALWEDVIPTLTNERAPQPMVMRLNSTDCAEFQHTNLVPNVYQLDDYQVRTPTDIIGQHIHLVKFDVMSADGSANGWNYEDGTLSPDEVRERIEAFNHGGGLTRLDGTVTTGLAPEAHPFFGPTGPNEEDWRGARTTIQRWYADPLLERSWDGGVGTVFTHDHYGPSTHQQVGLYSTLLVEPKGSIWRHNETGDLLGTRHDGGPSGWQAIIEPGGGLGDADFDAHREFYFEFADFQHAYERNGGALASQPNEQIPALQGLWPEIDIPSYADFDDAVNPSFRQPPPDPADIFFHPNACPGPLDPNGNPTFLPRPCPEAISADDPGTYALNFRNEPIGLRVFEDANLNGQLDPGEDTNGNGVLDQVAGDAGDLARAYQSRTDRAIDELNVQPETNGISPYPPLTADVRPGDPWTPMLRVYMGDKVRIRVQVGAHEEEHNFTMPGLKWKQESNVPNSGWKNSEFFGIDEYFNLDVPIVPDTSSGTPGEVDYIYTVGAELEGMWNGVWGIMRSYGKERADLEELPTNDVGRNGYEITNEADFDGICPIDAPPAEFSVAAVRAKDVLNQLGQPRQPGEPEGWLVYNDRTTTLDAPPGGVSGSGPLIDPTALMYVMTDDLIFDAAGEVIGLRLGTPVEPLILRVNAGDCVKVDLANALPPDLSDTEMPGYNALPPIVHEDGGSGGKTSFNANDLTPSSMVGLTPQLLAFDPRTDGGFSTGLTTGKLVAPGDTGSYQWYAGDVSVTSQGAGPSNRVSKFTLAATAVEFGAVGLMPADRIEGTESGFVGAMVVEPLGATWAEDPGTRTQATVTKVDGSAFRDFVTIMQNDVNLRYGGMAQVINPDGTPGAAFDCAADPSPMECAVPNIAAEGPLGPPEDPQDTGQKAINYEADPLWFRLGITPDTPFGSIHRDPELEDTIPRVFSNFLEGVGGDPGVPVYRASPGGPDEARFRVLMPGGHARGTTWTLHGHQWQRQPYVNGSSEIGDNPRSEYFGTQEGINPTGHWDFVVDLGGKYNVTGDYLFRDQGSFGSYQGLWGLLRFDNTEPIAADAGVSVPKYGTTDPFSVGFDLDGDPITATGASPFGTITDLGGGQVTYTSTTWPACGDPFVCTDEIVVTLNGGATARVRVDVLNTAPVADNDTVVIKAPATDGAVDVLLNDFDAEGDLDPARNPVVTLTGQPVDRLGNDVGTIADAVLGADGRTVTYTPPAGFAGVVLITYTVTDESGAVSIPATIRAAVNVDDITITQAQYQSANGQWTLAGTCTDPFLPDGATPTQITILFGPSIEEEPPEIGTATCIAGDPIGTWNFSGRSGDPDNTTPDPNEFNFVSAVSALQGFNEGFPVAFAGQNNVPVAGEDAYTIVEDTVLNDNVLVNDTDADFDPLTAVLVTDVANGTLVLDADGTFSYTPNADFNGADNFTYYAHDGKERSNDATVTITIDGVNDAPRAGDDRYATAKGVELSEGLPGVLGNDSDVEGDAFTLDTNPVTNVADGTLTLNPDGSFTYTPDPLFTGTDSFVYQICETATPDLHCGQAMVSISVGVNDAPVAVDDAYSAAQNTPLEIPIAGPPVVPGILDNDTDADFDPLTVSTVNGAAANVGVEITLASDATLTVNADGSFTYTPLFNFTGTDSFTYTANDGTVDSNAATVTITVQDAVEVTSATYRIRQDRWQIQGTVSDTDSTVDVYMCTDDACTTPVLIGAANVNDIDGSWNINGSGATSPPEGGPAWVIAVTSVGTVSDPPTLVSIRN